MTVLARVAGIVCAAGGLFAVATASSIPLTVHEPDDAVLRLTWSARPERIENCRPRTAEELAALPRHMRQPMVCEGVTAAQYRLIVRRDDAVIADEVVRGGGLRHDRLLYVFHEIAMTAGDVAIDVRFDRIDPERSSQSTGPAPITAAIPPHLELEQRLQLRPRAVVLVTYDPQRRTLVARP